MTDLQIQTVNTGALAMDYFRFGRGEKTFVILPGLSMQSIIGFAELVAEAYQIFADEFTVYVFDRRKELPAAYDVADMARDTAEVFRALGLSRIHLFGASQGGMIAMKTAVGHPERIEKLVLCSTACRMGEERFRTVEKWIRLARERKRAELYLAFGEAVYPPDIFKQAREQFVEASGSVTDKELERFAVLAEGMRGFDAAAELGKIDCPVLVIGSKDDRVLGAEAPAELAERLRGKKGSVSVLYDGYGHAVYDTAPDFKERVLDFFMNGGSE